MQILLTFQFRISFNTALNSDFYESYIIGRKHVARVKYVIHISSL
jgi:hypothetical protein